MINHILCCIFCFCCFVSCNNSNNSKIETVDQLIKVKEKKADEPASYIEKLKNRQPVEIDEHLIFGEWEDQNSIVTYQKDYKFYGSFDKYRLKQQELGTFEILGDTLQMHFTSINHHPAYIISAINSNEFTIESLDDGAIFYKKRIK